MSRTTKLTHEFVEFMPTDLRDGVLYVSVSYATATHRCCCGCGREVVTPLTPTDWRMIFDGETVSLDPSIGNWSFPCRSHYWVKRNRVQWAATWSRDQVDAGRARDHAAKERQFETGGSVCASAESPTELAPPPPPPKAPSRWRKLRDWWTNGGR